MSTRQNGVMFVALWVLLTAITLGGEQTVGSKESVKEPAWPPAQMKHLPAGYIDRLREALQLNADRIDSLTASDKPVLWARAGIGGFALGQHVDEINRYFESDSFEFGGSDKFGFSLFSSTNLRAYALFNHRTGTMKGLLSQQAEKKFEDFIWQVAKANSKLAEARRGVWEWKVLKTITCVAR